MPSGIVIDSNALQRPPIFWADLGIVTDSSIASAKCAWTDCGNWVRNAVGATFRGVAVNNLGHFPVHEHSIKENEVQVLRDVNLYQLSASGNCISAE